MQTTKFTIWKNSIENFILLYGTLISTIYNVIIKQEFKKKGSREER